MPDKTDKTATRNLGAFGDQATKRAPSAKPPKRQRPAPKAAPEPAPAPEPVEAEAIPAPAEPPVPSPAPAPPAAPQPKKASTKKAPAKPAEVAVGERSTSRISVSIPADLLTQIQTKADEEQIWASDVIRDALADHGPGFEPPAPTERRTRRRGATVTAPFSLTLSTSELEVLDTAVGDHSNRSAVLTSLIRLHLT